MFKKYRDNSDDPLCGAPYLLNFTQPNMAFTPRQIIEQFASGEIVAQENTPTDDFYDDKYTDDELVGITQLDDDFTARQMVIDFQLEQQSNETKTSADLRAGAQETPASATSSVSVGDVKNDMVDTDTPGV